MKLSEMNTKQLANAICQLTAPMSRIAKDESLNGVFAGVAEKMQAEEHMTMLEKFGMILDAVPVLLMAHYGDMIRIAAVMLGKTDAEVAEMNGYAMIEELRESIDKEFIDFFRSYAVMGKTLMVERG